MKLKTHKISIVGYIAGLTWIAMAIPRWWFIYHDPSQLVTALLVGCLIVGGAYVYNWMRNQEDMVKSFNKDIKENFNETWTDMDNIRKRIVKVEDGLQECKNV